MIWLALAFASLFAYGFLCPFLLFELSPTVFPAWRPGDLGRVRHGRAAESVRYLCPWISAEPTWLGQGRCLGLGAWCGVCMEGLQHHHCECVETRKGEQAQCEWQLGKLELCLDVVNVVAFTRKRRARIDLPSLLHGRQMKRAA